MADQKLTKLANDLAPLLRRKLSTTTISGGAGAGAGVDDHGLLGGLADNDHPQYLLRIGGNAMADDLDMGGHDIRNVALIDGFDINGFSGVLSGLQMDVAALKLRTVYGGDGLLSDEVAFGDGSPTLDVVVADFAGAGLMDDGNNNLRIRVGDGLELDGLYLAVNEDFDFAWTGDHTFAGDLSSSAPAFNSADPITGWKIDSDGNAWFAAIEATTLTIKTFISDVTLALQGSEIVAKSKGILSRDYSTPTTTGTLYVYDLPGQPNTAVFENGDFIRLRYVNRTTGLNVGDVWGTVSSYTDLDDGEQSWTFTRTAGNPGQTIYAGMVAIDYGQSGDGYIILDSLGDDAPYMDVRTWTSTPAVAGNHTTIARIGTLGGITDADLGILSGEGIYTLYGYFKGDLVAAGGDVWIDNNGMGLVAESVNTLNSGAMATSSVGWFTDPSDQGSDTEVAHIAATRFEGSGRVFNRMFAHVEAGTTSGADVADIYLTADHETNFGQARLWLTNLYPTSNRARAALYATNADGGAGDIILSGDVTLAIGEVLAPQFADGAALGTSARPWSDLYVTTLHAGTVSSTDTGHDHDDRYNTKAEITAALSAKSDVGHTHGGYVTSVSLATTLADYVDADALALALADYDTSAEVDVKISGLSAAVHTHNLADLAERNYSSLTSRGHVLASTTGLGADHTVAGLTAGMVLRASGAKSARFAVLDYADLGTTAHDINSEHTGTLPWERVSKSGSNLIELETRKYADLTNRTHNVVSEHSVTAVQYAVLGTWAGANTLGMEPASSDGTVPHTLLMSGDNGELSLQKLHGSGGVLLFDDVLRSSNYVSGRSGFNLSQDGLEVSNADIRGTLRSGLLQAQGTLWTYGTQLFGPSGKIIEELEITAPGTQVTVAVADDDAGHAAVFGVGEILKLSGPAYVVTDSNSEGTVIEPWVEFVMATGVISDAEIMVAVWLDVDSISDQVTHYEYTCTVRHGPRSIWSPGAVIGSYGTATTGRIAITSDALYAPYLDLFTTGTTPWQAVISHLRLGKLDGLAVGAGDRTAPEYGLAAAADLSDSDAGWLIASNRRVKGYNLDLEFASGDMAMTIDAAEGIVWSNPMAAAGSWVTNAAALTWYDSVGENTTMYVGPYYDGQLFDELSIIATHHKSLGTGVFAGNYEYAAYVRLAAEPSSGSPGTRKAEIRLQSTAVYYQETGGLGGDEFSEDAAYINILADDGVFISGPVRVNTEINLPNRVNGWDLPRSTFGLPSGFFYADASGYVRMVL